MKKLVLILGGVVAIALFSAPLPCYKQALAISGCCKQLKGRNWVKIHSDFKKCRIQNVKERDNIFHQSGSFWWDTRC